MIDGKPCLTITMVLKLDYNDAESADLNGDGLDDILVASTRGVPYYAGRHVQILISNGDGTFKDETEIRFANQPRANSN